MRATGFLPLLLALPFLFACPGSGGGSTNDLPTSLCDPGVTACLGNYVATCSDDGRAWTGLRACYPDGQCVQGACTPRKCTPAGRNECVSTDVARLCSADGLVQTTLPCDKFQSCYGGACLPDACDPARDAPTCTFDTRVVCDGGTRKEEPCPAGQACVGNACAPREDCIPEEARCSGETASGVCRLNGTGWDVTICKADEHCVGGFCVKRLADLLPEDAAGGEDVPGELPGDAIEDTGTDAGGDAAADVPYVAPNRALLNNAPVDFVNLPLVSITPGHDQVESQVSILLQSDRLQGLPLPLFPDDGASLAIEIILVGVDTSTLGALKGTYLCTSSKGPRARIWLRYGLNPTATSGACKNYDFGAGICTVTITDVGVDGAGPIVGTFDAPRMADCNEGTGYTVDISQGTLDAEP